MTLAFMKMHGLGNDFVVIDARAVPVAIDGATAQAIADRRTGVGFDQLILLRPPRDHRAAVRAEFLNADGSESDACGNGLRCVARLILAETGAERVAIETRAGLLAGSGRPDGPITVDMGPARLEWRDIPVAAPCDTAHLPVAEGPLADPVGVGMGNPHAVFFVADLDSIDLERLGAVLERHPFFPERVNVGVARVIDPARLRLRVFERGVGITRACGSGACAALVAAARRGLTGRVATVEMDGGALDVAWGVDGRVALTGATAIAFHGHLDALLARHP